MYKIGARSKSRAPLGRGLLETGSDRSSRRVCILINWFVAVGTQMRVERVRLQKPKIEKRLEGKKRKEYGREKGCLREGTATWCCHIIHLFVVDGRVHDDGVGGRRGSSKRRSRRVATAARGATAAAARATTAAAAAATTAAVTVAILVAGGEEALHSAGRHRRSFSLIHSEFE